jgi:hypothetical protein
MSRKMRFLGLFLLVLPPVACTQTVNGNTEAAFAVGKWKESREGVSVICVHVTTTKDVVNGVSSGACFVTEAQGKAKDSVSVSTNTFAVTAWDEHGLSAITEFYADRNGSQTDKSEPGAIKYTFRLVIKYDAHQVMKFVEASNGNTVGYHLEEE